MRVIPESAGAGQESVWNYPRPAVAEACSRHICIMHGGVAIANTWHSIRTLETSHPPSYYLPPEDVTIAVLRRSARRSFCEWKGEAQYFDLVLPDTILQDVAWTYPDPTRAFRSLRDHLAFYARPLEDCRVDGELVTPQPGMFYGGWINSHVTGPFKGVPGSHGW